MTGDVLGCGCITDEEYCPLLVVYLGEGMRNIEIYGEVDATPNTSKTSALAEIPI